MSFVIFFLFLSSLSISAFSNLSFYNITSIESIMLAAQMDRGSAFQGVLRTERRLEEEEAEEEEPWK